MMKKIFAILALVGASVAVFGQLKVTEHTLSNGMKVWLNEDHSSARVFGAVVVRAGAIDCPGTGIAHYFEHIAFKGTDKIGTIDYDAEKVYLDSIEVFYNELAQTKDEERRKFIQTQINRLSIKSAQYVIPNEFDNIIGRFGGSDLNAYTSSDHTVYHNSFSAQYVNQWCEINSERLLNPVFRLFQSELETIYEEKNMSDDQLGSIAMEKLMEYYYAPNPNAYTVIGTTESLKNPSMAAMRAYYDAYYVGRNMGLAVSGDFDSESILPLLERTFGRIKSGAPNARVYTPARQFAPREMVDIKLNIPILTARALAWRGISSANEDVIALDMASDMLTNSGSTGYLDKLVSDGKFMTAYCLSVHQSNNGMLAVAVVPNIMGMSVDKAEDVVIEQIERLKKGDVDSALLSSVKLTKLRQYLSNLETLDSRSTIMIDRLNCDKSWNSYFDDIEKIKNMTPAQIAEVANKYFTSNYGVATKKMGDYEKDKLPKPGFAPITPSNRGAKSAYAAMLDSLPTLERSPKFLEFDVPNKSLAPLATLYYKANEVNSLFSVDLIFNRGYGADKRLQALQGYMDYVGTKDKFSTELQKLGGYISFVANRYSYIVNVKGMDVNFDATMALVGEFLTTLDADDSKAKKVAQDYVLEDHSFKKSSSDVTSALFNLAAYGADKSYYFLDLSPSEVRKARGSDYVATWNDVKASQCEVVYCGSKGIDAVAATLNKVYDFENSKVAHSGTHYIEPIVYDKPTIFFVDMPSARQTIIYGITPVDGVKSGVDAAMGSIVGNYIGGGMSSLLFQEIREFRSMAYGASATVQAVTPKAYGQSTMMRSYLSTQADKAGEAIMVLDSIIGNITIDDNRLMNTKSELTAKIYNNYPSMRDEVSEIVLKQKIGHTADPNITMLSTVNSVTASELQQFYNSHIHANQTYYIIVGNAKGMDMNAIKKLGTIKVYKTRDLKRR